VHFEDKRACRFCAGTAIALVVYGTTVRIGRDLQKLREQAEERLSAAIVQGDKGWLHARPHVRPRQLIEEWNDEPGRTQAEVSETLRRAADR